MENIFSAQSLATPFPPQAFHACAGFVPRGTHAHLLTSMHIFSHRGLDPEASMVSCCAAPFVKFMMDNMEKRGCKVQEKDFFVVRHCDEKVGGGFDESASKHGGVVLCQNHIRDFQHTGSSVGFEHLQQLVHNSHTIPNVYVLTCSKSTALRSQWRYSCNIYNTNYRWCRADSDA